MPKYLIQANYVGDGVKGLIEEGGSKRREAVARLFESMGGRLESMYYAIGDTDVFIVGEFPDNVSAVAANLAAARSGAVRCRTTVLLTPEEIDQASRKTPAYRAPGG